MSSLLKRSIEIYSFNDSMYTPHLNIVLQANILISVHGLLK